MRWFAGCHGCHDDVLPVRLPAAGRRIAADDALAVVGEWEPWEVRSVEAGAVRVTVLGTCLASDRELVTCLAEAARLGNYVHLSRLAGSFVAVVRDGARTAIVPDLAGQLAVFYVRRSGTFVFASAGLPLAGLSAAPPNPSVLAAHLLCPEITELAGDQSVYEGVSRIRPGHALVLDGDDARQVRLPIEIARSGFSEAAGRLRHELERSVAGRAARAEQMSTDLSGGLDSSTLAVLAAEHLPAGMLAVTHHDACSSNDEDVAYAKKYADTVSGIRHLVVHTDESALPFQDLEHAPLADEPSQESLLFARTRALFAPVAASGSKIHLTGDGGDAVLAGNLTYLADLARGGRLRELAREATAWARLRNSRAHPLVRAAIRTAVTSQPRAMRQTSAVLRDPVGFDQTAGITGVARRWAPTPAVRWMTRNARAEIADRLDDVATSLGASSRTSLVRVGDASALRGVRWNAATARVDGELTRSLGVNLHSPFFDNNVVRACFAAPVADRTTARTAKPLLAAATAGLVPRELLARRTKGNHTAAHYAGMRRAAADLRDLLDQPRLADLGMLEPAPARAVLDQAIHGVRGPIAALADVLATELWLRQLSDPDLNPYAKAWTTAEKPHRRIRHA